jgi:hypothetical protein
MLDDKQIMSELVSRSADRAQALLLDLLEDHDPFDAMVTTLLAVSVLAKSLGMPRETLLEGAGAAFDSLVEATQHAAH